MSGGLSDPWVRYEYVTERDARLPGESFPFQHRFLLGFDAASKSAYARVFLLGVVELTVSFGAAPIYYSETLIHDVDVTATRGPDDVRVHRIPGDALHPPAAPTANPLPFVQERLPVLMAKRAVFLWEQEAHQIVTAMNAVRTTPLHERHERIVEALRGQEQRLLNLAAFIVNDFKRHLSEQFGPDAAAVVDVLAPLAEPDGKSRTGVSNVTAVHADMLRYVMADHLLVLLDDRVIESAELRALLEGLPGASVVGKYMLGQLQSVRPDLFSDDVPA